MATDIKWKVTAASTVLKTELNSLADAARAITGAIDNTTALDLYDDIQLKVEYTSSAPAAGVKMGELYLVPSVDGTNYAEGSTSLTPQKSQLVGTFESRNGATATFEYLVIQGVPIPPLNFKYLFVNTSGKALAASGNTLVRTTYKIQSA